MKNKLLIAVLMGLISVTAYAQKGELSNAQKEYENYTTIGSNKATAALAKTSLTNAKTSIDKASTNPKTAELPLTYALKAAVYASLASQDSVATTAAVSYSTASEAQKKALELDTKGDNKKITDHTNLELAQYNLNQGVVQYQNKKYDDAYKSFDAARQILPEDTTTILNTALAAINAKNYTAAIANYNKLATLNYTHNDRTYTDLPTLYLLNKDTTGALKSIADGIAKYPNNNDLRKREIEINLQSGRQNDLLTKIDAAIKKDPQNKTLYYYQGLTYSQIAQTVQNDYKKAIKTPAKGATGPSPATVALKQKEDDSFAKAAEMYKKAIALDPNYFEANLNLGYVIISPAIDDYNDVQQLPVSKQKEYDAGMAKTNAEFDAAKPYLLKAVELNPKSIDALTNLKSYYLGKKDTANANATQKQIDALPAGQ